MTDPTWKQIPGHERYEASDTGHIRRHLLVVRKQRRLSTSDAGGYRQIMLWHEGGWQHCLVHRLVCTAFHGPCPDGMECCHANDIKDDNRADNLRWGTRQDNMNDRVRNGKTGRRAKYMGVGPNNSSVNPFTATLNYGGVTKHLGVYPTEEEAAAAYNDEITRQCIDRPLNQIPMLV